MDKRVFKITSDGSHTLYLPDLDETYHSVHGAIQEAKHVFIEAGLNYFTQSNLKILEVGFGTGLNAFLTLLYSKKKSVNINYTAIELFPLENEVVKKLNYTNELKTNLEDNHLFHFLHQVEWESYQKISSQFYVKKVKSTLMSYQANEQFDLIYFDAFGPRVQPEMWTKSIFEKMHNALIKGGVLVTYCAKGSVKRTLKEIGFEVENLPGPPGKREMTRAKKYE